MSPLPPSQSGPGDLRSRIFLCNHSGQAEALMHSMDLLEHWLMEEDNDPDLLECMVEYARGRGGITMTNDRRDM